VWTFGLPKEAATLDVRFGTVSLDQVTFNGVAMLENASESGSACKNNGRVVI